VIVNFSKVIKSLHYSTIQRLGRY